MGCCNRKIENPSRTVSFDPSLNQQYPDNSIKTTKYNLLTFLPKATILQFLRPANTVYLVTAIVQSIPIISSLHPATAIAPFIFVIGLALIREAYEDYNRYCKDKETNEKGSRILRNQQFVECRWEDIKVGDIIKVLEDEMIPADMVMLYSTEQNSICYVETANLDGESNLKSKVALNEGISQYPEEFNKLKGQLVVEAPNSDLHSFQGELMIEGNDRKIIDFQNFLIRGTSIRNTGYVVGVVVYAGKSTKIMCNQSDIRHKVSNVEKRVNKIQLFLFFILFMLSLGCSIGYYLYHTRYGNGTRQQIWYLRTSNNFNMRYQSFLIFFTSFLLLSFIIPVSMNVSLELVKFFQGLLISFDKKMYYQPINKKCKVMNMSIIEELGLIDYILTDKTGTLTANEMKFQHAWINCQKYNAQSLLKKFETNKKINENRQENDFWTSVVICHDVVVDKGKRQFQGSSPDEVCFVQFADSVGYTFVKRTKNSIQLDINGQKKAYQFLHIIPFTSRKRMSVLVRDLQTSLIILHTKGADSAILQKCSHHQSQILSSLTSALSQYSKQGLRTLVFSQRFLSQQQYDQFMKKVNGLKREKISGQISKQEIEKKEEGIIEEIQSQLQIIGASAIEDRLQEGVPETIERLQQAGIKVMMITGDKLETAQNIGYLSSLIDHNAEIFRIRTDTKSLDCEVKQILSKIDKKTTSAKQSKFQDSLTQVIKKRQQKQSGLKKRKIGEQNSQIKLQKIQKNQKRQKICVLIEGKMISQLIDEEKYRQQYAQLITQCDSVIFCRSTPKEKAKIVRFVKKRLRGLTLAIGDGGNDVGMIEQANVGVGVAGKQGNQASASSDFSFGQFRFLDRLLLHHGRWGYYRMSYFFVYYGWKNMIMTLLIFYFLIDSAFSGFPAFSQLFIAIYNAFIGLMLLLYYSVLEQDINADTYPQAYPYLPIFYKQFKKMDLFSYKRYMIWTVLGIALSLFINFLINNSLGSTQLVDSDGHVADFKTDAQAGAIGLSLAIILVIIVDIYNFTCCTVLIFIVLLTIVACCVIFLVENFVDIGSVTGSLSDNTNLRFWSVIILIGGVSFMIKYVCFCVQFLVWPSETEKQMGIRERKKRVKDGDDKKHKQQIKTTNQLNLDDAYVHFY